MWGSRIGAIAYADFHGEKCVRLLDHYIRDAVIGATILVVFVLLGVESFMEFVGQFSSIGVSHFDFWKAFVYVLTQLPSDLYQLFPMIGFLGCLVGLGRLAASSQLIVIQMAGISVRQITWSVIKAALILIAIMVLMGEFIAPKLQTSGDNMKAVALSHAVGYKALGGVWLRDGPSFVHISSIISAGEVHDVSRFIINDQHRLLSASFSPKGVFQEGHWVLEDVTTTHFSADRLTQTKEDRMPLKVVFDPNELEEGRKSIDQQSIGELYQSIHYREKAGLETTQYIFNFWQRILRPFTTAVMICLGVPFIFGSLRSVSMGFRVLTGVIIGFVFYMLNQFFGPFAMVYQITPLFASLMPTLLFATACVILLRRAQH